MIHLFSHKSHNLAKHHQGFTLVEFVVIISIFAIMASVALFDFKGFQNNIGTNNLTHDIALEIRQAQVFGWATLGQSDNNTTITTDTNGNPIHQIQGIYFGYGNAVPNRFDKQFVLYSKPAGSTTSEYESTDAIVDTVKIQGPNHISDIESAQSPDDLQINAATHQMTNTSGGAHQITDRLSIGFSRPRPEPVFWVGSATNNFQSTDNYVAIYVSADTDPQPTNGGTPYVDHVILVSRLGEIEVH